MPVEWFLALRYLTATRKQTLVSVVSVIAVAGVAVGVMALVIALALMTGFSSDIQAKILGAEAHVFVYGDRLSGGIRPWAAIAAEAEGIPHVLASAPNALDAGMLESAIQRDRASLRGIDPEREARVTDLAARMVAGSLQALSPAADGKPRRRPGLLLGRELADELGVGVGDVLRYQSFAVSTLSPLGPVPRRLSFEVAGVFETGLYEYDRTWALAALPVIQELLGEPDGATTVKLKVDSLDHITAVSAEARRRFGQRYVVKDLLALNRPLFSAFKLEKLLMFIAVGLIVVVASLNIVTTLTMMVMEKNKDIGILMAMGLTPSSVLRVFLYQGLVIGSVGTLLGMLAGVGLSVLLDHYQLITLDTSVYYIPYLPFRVKALDVALVGSTAVLVSFVATLPPSRRAARLDPVEALRWE